MTKQIKPIIENAPGADKIITSAPRKTSEIYALKRYKAMIAQLYRIGCADLEDYKKLQDIGNSMMTKWLNGEQS